MLVMIAKRILFQIQNLKTHMDKEIADNNIV